MCHPVTVEKIAYVIMDFSGSTQKSPRQTGKQNITVNFYDYDTIMIPICSHFYMTVEKISLLIFSVIEISYFFLSRIKILKSGYSFKSLSWVGQNC